jgi:hypothetical protein
MDVFHNRQPVWLGAEGATTWLDLSIAGVPLITSPPLGALIANPPSPVAA